MALTAGEAFAANVKGTNGPNVLIGTQENDTLRGKDGDDGTLDGCSGNDRLLGGSCNDDTTGGAGRGVISGGTGQDTISTQDGEADRINRGPGIDRAFIDALDKTVGCEEVVDRRRVAG